MRRLWVHAVVTAAGILVAACAGEVETQPDARLAGVEQDLLSSLSTEIDRIDGWAAAIDSIFQPLPLMTPDEESALRRFGNAQQLERARSLGVTGDRSAARLARLTEAGELVVLEDTEHWVVRRLDYSQPLVIPSVRGLLTEIAERFQARLAELGAPAFRLEITSVLRSAEDQVRLRAVNANAAAGESTHQFGTTVDIAYNAFAAPADPIMEPSSDTPEALHRHLERYAAVAAERVGARRALELKAILGDVLLAMQSEGRVLVTLERQQPVFHMTVAN